MKPLSGRDVHFCADGHRRVDVERIAEAENWAIRTIMENDNHMNIHDRTLLIAVLSHAFRPTISNKKFKEIKVQCGHCHKWQAYNKLKVRK